MPHILEAGACTGFFAFCYLFDSLLRLPRMPQTPKRLVSTPVTGNSAPCARHVRYGADSPQGLPPATAASPASPSHAGLLAASGQAIPRPPHRQPCRPCLHPPFFAKPPLCSPLQPHPPGGLFFLPEPCGPPCWLRAAPPPPNLRQNPWHRRHQCLWPKRPPPCPHPG